MTNEAKYYLVDLCGDTRTIWGPPMALATAHARKRATDFVATGRGCVPDRKLRRGELQIAMSTGAIRAVHADGSETTQTDGYC